MIPSKSDENEQLLRLYRLVLWDDNAAAAVIIDRVRFIRG